MSCNYAENLSHYENKGKLGLPEIFDSAEEVERKCIELADLLKTSSHTVVHTGAGVSTSAGIPDFRGPNGVWTLEKKGQKPTINVSWDEAKPTQTHMALLALQKAGYIAYIVTQNIDGLHLRSGIPRTCLAELHGNLFVSECGTCKRQMVRHDAVETVGLKTQGVTCPGKRLNGRRKCRGKLYDTILDWEDSLPDADLELAHMHSCCADLSLCLGSTLQIMPSGNLPVHTKKRGGKFVICNLQPTKQDKHADLIINSYVDDIMVKILEILKIPIPKYSSITDPVYITKEQLLSLGFPMEEGIETTPPDYPTNFEPIDWTVKEAWTKEKTLVNKFKGRKIIKAKKLSINNDQTSTSHVITENGNSESSTKLKEELVAQEDMKVEHKVKIMKFSGCGISTLKEENVKINCKDEVKELTDSNSDYKILESTMKPKIEIKENENIIS